VTFATRKLRGNCSRAILALTRTMATETSSEMTTVVRPIAADVARNVACLSVCLSVCMTLYVLFTPASCAKIAEPVNR